MQKTLKKEAKTFRFEKSLLEFFGLKDGLKFFQIHNDEKQLKGLRINMELGTIKNKNLTQTMDKSYGFLIF